MELNTVIVYAPESADDALTLSAGIPDALLSSYEGVVEEEYQIILFVGSDYEDVVE